MIIIDKNVVTKLEKELLQAIKNDFSNNPNVGNKSIGVVQKIKHTDFFKDRMMMRKVIKAGVPYSLFTVIQSYTPFSEKDWSTFLELSTKSLSRYKLASKNFKSIHSEKIIEMAEVTTIGLDVFGSLDKFKLWLNTPNFSLGTIKPIDLLTDSYGKELVVSELTRINYGILV